MRTVVRLAALVGLVSFQALAQTEVCRDVYLTATANVSASERQAASAQYVSDNQCNSDKSVSSFNMTASVEAVFDKLPASFNMGIGTRNERLTQFCKNYLSQDNYASTVNEYSRTVVVNSLNLFNQCLDLLNSGIKITNNASLTTSTVDDFTVSVSFDSGMSYDITSVTFDPKKLACTTTGFRADGKSQKLQSPLAQKVSVSKSFDITCNRISSVQGRKIYEEARFTLGIGKKPYTLILPADQSLTFTSATRAKTQIDQLNKANNSLISQRSELNKKVVLLENSLQKAKGAVIETYGMSMGESPVNGWIPVLIARGNFGYKDENEYRDAQRQKKMEETCGGRKIVGYKWLSELGRPGGCCGYQFYIFGCSKEQ